MTSNLGSELLLNNKQDEVERLLRSKFRPEFLNRIDEIVYFKPLGKEVQFKIVTKMLNILNDRLKENYFSFEFSEKLKKWILDSSFSFEFGARPIKRFISNEVETIIAQEIIEGKIDTKHKYLVDYDDNKVVIKAL